jgi:hypothetical protein
VTTNSRGLAKNLDPRLLHKTDAAAYCAIAPATFEKACPVAPVMLSGRIARWDRRALDKWIDSLGVGESIEEDNSLVRVWDDRNRRKDPRIAALPA